MTRDPEYVRIAQALREEIDDGLYAPGSAIPSEYELRGRFRVALMTVRQAVDVLKQEGLVEARNDGGTYVLDKPAPELAGVVTTDTQSVLAAATARRRTPVDRARLAYLAAATASSLDDDPAYSKHELAVELRAVITDLAAVIEATREAVRGGYGYSEGTTAEQAQDAHGRPLLADMLSARANALAALTRLVHD